MEISNRIAFPFIILKKPPNVNLILEKRILYHIFSIFYLHTAKYLL